MKPLRSFAGAASGGSGGVGSNPIGGTDAQLAGGSGGSGGAGGSGGDAAIDVDPDAGDATRCGDGMVSGVELCDTAIAVGSPGACPTECEALSDCVKRALTGTGCRAECVVLQADCEDDDGCCPGECTPNNDSDCSATCGDGLVQTETETCEPEPAGDAATACPDDCDDGDACTMDVLSGSAMNCNVECAHVELTALADGDDCCPDGADMTIDSDCEPVCGNHVRERGEDCDSETGCNGQCDLGYTTAQRHCLDTFAISNRPCDVCMCTSCTQKKLDCFEDSDATRGALCVDLQACVISSGCFDSECFCGTAFACFPPNGACRVEVEAAAGTTNALDIDMRKMDTSYAIGRSYAMDLCAVDACATECQ